MSFRPDDRQAIGAGLGGSLRLHSQHAATHVPPDLAHAVRCLFGGNEEARVNEGGGVLAAMASTALGGMSVAATRYVIGASDPLTIGAFRFGIGFALLLPLALRPGERWPARRDWPAVAGLGVLLFGLFPILFNASVIFTTAARAGLSLATVPLITMAAAAAFGVEPLTARKTAGVLVAMLGVGIALIAGLSGAPEGAWRGDLLMVAAAGCMALHNVWSKPFIRRSGPLPFTVAGMGSGAICLAAVSLARGGFAAVPGFGAPQWLAIGFLGVAGGALTFILWVIALGRATPTRVAVAVTVNPVTASLLGAVLLGEPLRWNLAVGLATVLLGILLATRAPPARG